MLATAAWQAIDVFTMDDMLRCITRIVSAMEAAGFDAKDLFGTRLALEEAIVNAIRIVDFDEGPAAMRALFVGEPSPVFSCLHPQPFRGRSSSR